MFDIEMFEAEDIFSDICKDIKRGAREVCRPP